MKAFAVLAFCAASVAANGYGSSYGGSQETRSSGYGGGYGGSQQTGNSGYGGSQDVRSGSYGGGYGGAQDTGSSSGYGGGYGGGQDTGSSNGYGGGYGSQSQSHIPIMSFNNDIRGSESNSHSYETGNGISVSESTHVARGRYSSYDAGNGQMVQTDSALVKQGRYSYTSPEGQRISTGWRADEGGFRASGDHLPRSVEMPADHAEAHRQANAQVFG